LRYFADPVEGIASQDKKVVRYHTKNETGEMRVTITEQPCSALSGGELFDYRVQVLMMEAGKTAFRFYDGCGCFIQNPGLHNIWALEELNGEPVTGDSFTDGIPEIEINLDESSVTGSDGCNSFSGKVIVSRNRITFKGLAGTEKMCLKMEASDVFISILTMNHLTFLIQDDYLIINDRRNNSMKLRSLITD